MSEILLEGQQRLAAMSEKLSKVIAAEEERKRITTLENKNCFVCYLDLDGFKHEVMCQPQKLYESYRSQREFMLSSFFRANASCTEGEDVKLSHFDKLLWPYMFSDSWFFASIDNTPESLRQICTAAAGIMMRCLEIGFPARGGIGGGYLWWNPEKQIILGPAIVRAYSVAESLNCFGVAIHPELSSRTTDGAFTSPLRTPITNKQCKLLDRFFCSYKYLRFACFSAHKTHRTWRIERWLQRYDELAKEYEAQRGAKKHVIRRYRESRKIIEQMLQSEPDCS